MTTAPTDLAANLAEQDRLMRRHAPVPLDSLSGRTVGGRTAAEDAQLAQLRAAMTRALREGAPEPDWSAAPIARRYFGK